MPSRSTDVCSSAKGFLAPRGLADKQRSRSTEVRGENSRQTSLLSMSDSDMKSITVIVPVRNESACIEATLRSLLEQDYPPDRFEVIVADGQSTDDTVAIVRRLQDRYANLKFYYNPYRFSSGGRNVALHHATGDYIVIVDGHTTVPTPNYLREVAQAFEESGAATLGRPQPLRVENATAFQRGLAAARESILGHNPHSDIYSEVARWVPPQNVAVAYRREVFETVGFFDTRFDACEDVEFNTRVDAAGFRCYFTPKIRIDYHPRATWRGLFYQMMRYGKGRARLAWKHPHSLTLPAVVPSAFLLWLLLTGILGWVITPLAAVFLLSLGVYLLAIVGVTIDLAIRKTKTALWVAPLALPTIHLGFGWGFLKELAWGWRPLKIPSSCPETVRQPASLPAFS